MFDWEMKCLSLDLHSAAAQSMASNATGILNETSATRESEDILEMGFLKGPFGKTVHALRNFNQAFFAFSLFEAGGRDLQAESFCALEKGFADTGLAFPVVYFQINAHAFLVAIATNLLQITDQHLNIVIIF